MHLKLAEKASVAVLLFSLLSISHFHFSVAEDPYRFFNWNVTYGDIFPLGVRQRVCLSLNTFFSCFSPSSKWIWIFNSQIKNRESWSTDNSQVQIFILLPTTTSSSMFSIVWMSLFFFPGNSPFLSVYWNICAFWVLILLLRLLLRLKSVVWDFFKIFMKQKCSLDSCWWCCWCREELVVWCWGRLHFYLDALAVCWVIRVLLESGNTEISHVLHRMCGSGSRSSFFLFEL